jgi:hypothetical protein
MVSAVHGYYGSTGGFDEIKINQIVCHRNQDRVKQKKKYVYGVCRKK